jgi:hypothetical protein
LLDGARLELRELKARSTLFGAYTTCALLRLSVYTTCPLLRSDLEASAIEIKDLKHKFDHSSRYTVLSPLCEVCLSLKGKLFYAIKENTQLKQEVTYLSAHFEKTNWVRRWLRRTWVGLRRVQSNPYTGWGLALRGVRTRVGKVLLSSFLAPPSTTMKQQSIPPKLTTHLTQSLPSTLREKWGKKPLSREMKLLFVYFVAVLVT